MIERPRAGSDLAAELVAGATAAGLTVATAESLTGGLVAAAVVSVPGASRVLRGGVVAYDLAVKADLLGVDQGLLDAVGAVDEEVARQMAKGARRLLGADLGLATTGVAGPGPSDGVPAGTAWIACASRNGVVTRRLALGGDRETVRQGCARAVLELSLEALPRLSAPAGTVETDGSAGPVGPRRTPEERR